MGSDPQDPDDFFHLFFLLQEVHDASALWVPFNLYDGRIRAAERKREERTKLIQKSRILRQAFLIDYLARGSHQSCSNEPVPVNLLIL
eukprot:553449-Pelagomonas_calceolata.AAC.1